MAVKAQIEMLRKRIFKKKDKAGQKKAQNRSGKA
jgi:hypothetical protein